MTSGPDNGSIERSATVASTDNADGERAAPLGFSVDTHLLRELGELLVSRDSTAVMELIKNAYDADATHVLLHADALGSKTASLSIIDDGHGMTLSRFRSAYMRIAGRGKEVGDRLSPRFERKYTGEKGIGRLASHKLANRIRIVSVPDLYERTDASSLVLLDASDDESRVGVVGEFEWDVIEEQESLESLSRGISIAPLKTTAPHGTSLELTGLRGAWTSHQRHDFVQEVKSTSPPAYLFDDHVQSLVNDPTLIADPLVREHSLEDPGFQVELSGDLDEGEELWQQALPEFRWLVEIDGTEDDVRYQITPTVRQLEEEPLSKVYGFLARRPQRPGPRFQARIFARPGASTRVGPLAQFTRENSGVRVYMEGFRVMPFGGRGDDWLGLNQEYRSGARYYGDLSVTSLQEELPEDRREALTAVTNSSYYGAVFLTGSGLRGLRSLVNREGFVEDESYSELTDLVSTGIKLLTRVRRGVHNQRANLDRRATLNDQLDTAGIGAPEASQDYAPATGAASEQNASRHLNNGQPSLSAEDAENDALDDTYMQGAPPRWREAITAATEVARRLRTDSAVAPSAKALDDLAAGFDVSVALLQQLRDEQANLRVLASVGLQLGAFVHDINGLLGQTTTVRQLVERLVDEASDPVIRRRAARIRSAVDELAHGLARQSSYLTEVLGPDPRRRRSRTKLSERLAVSQRLLAGRMAAASVMLTADISDDLKTPPMFPAEVSVLLTNLLTNAVKNAGSPGRVHVEGKPLGSRGFILRVSNTGVRVDVSSSERWFQPFESTTAEIDDVLGQGLGLGLPIVRALVEDYGGQVAFVPPDGGYATSIEVRIPDRADLARQSRGARQ